MGTTGTTGTTGSTAGPGGSTTSGTTGSTTTSGSAAGGAGGFDGSGGGSTTTTSSSTTSSSTTSSSTTSSSTTSSSTTSSSTTSSSTTSSSTASSSAATTGAGTPTRCTEADLEVCSDRTGTHCGLTFEYWKDRGNGCLVNTADGFRVDWNNINNLLGRKGLRPGGKNNIVTYEADYRPNGNSYLSVYGWTRNPLIEYYIVDSWGNWRPPGGEGFVGTVTSDGGTYDIYKTQRVNQPSIDGNATFYQFWSVRQQKRTSGTITVGNHFDAWGKQGLTLGTFYEVSLVVEGYQSSGSADVKLSIE
ncbi:glycoside hydrolase family 11 protein [Sorangium sp. KYC3313]|uniref:glycoside hydrolase family 11 protein n=1 Tax=Sorangium sp. KYC3313 TaxID=3449740 RepID=UPI003F897409